MENLSLFAQMGIVAGMFTLPPILMIIAILFVIRSQNRAESQVRPRQKRRVRRGGRARMVARWPADAANDE